MSDGDLSQGPQGEEGDEGPQGLPGLPGLNGLQGEPGDDDQGKITFSVTTIGSYFYSLLDTLNS